jgi:trk system potassium uptake protein TrkA
LECLVIGLGIFGKAVVENLKNKGVSVVGVDSNPKSLQELERVLDESVLIDTTIEDHLRQLGVEHFDYCFVCIGEDMEANLITTMHLSSLGATRIISRSKSKTHELMLQKLGAYRIINPEMEIGTQLVQEISSNLDYFVKLRRDMAMITIMVPEVFVGKKIQELDLRKNYRINILWVEKQVPFVDATGKETVYDKIEDILGPGYLFNSYDKVTLMGSFENIKRFLENFYSYAIRQDESHEAQ